MGDPLQLSDTLVLLIAFGLFVIPAIFYIKTLQRALEKCAPSSRTLPPGTLWLLLVPLVNLIWHFLVVTGMANSLGNEFRRRNAPNAKPAPGQSIGIAMCICGVCCIIPVLGFIAAIAYLILWIVYWVKVTEYSRALDQSPSPLSPALLN
jgi:hypothetical protein